MLLFVFVGRGGLVVVVVIVGHRNLTLKLFHTLNFKD